MTDDSPLPLVQDSPEALDETKQQFLRLAQSLRSIERRGLTPRQVAWIEDALGGLLGAAKGHAFARGDEIRCNLIKAITAFQVDTGQPLFELAQSSQVALDTLATVLRGLSEFGLILSRSPEDHQSRIHSRRGI